MRIAQIPWVAAVLLLAIGGGAIGGGTIGCQPAAAEGWSLEKLNPFAKRVKYSTSSGRRYRTHSVEPSPVEKFNAGTKKFFSDVSTGAKKFFANTRDVLTGKKPASKSKPSYRYHPWIREPRSGRYLKSQEQGKSWLSSLFRREEPRPSRSLGDFLSAERLDP